MYFFGFIFQPLRNVCCHRGVITLHRVTQGKYEALETRFASPTQLHGGVTPVGVSRCTEKGASDVVVRWLRQCIDVLVSLAPEHDVQQLNF